MGITFDKIIPNIVSTNCPVHLKDLAQAGSVYFIEHGEVQESHAKKLCQFMERKTHFGLCIDVTGSSNTEQFVGFHYDLFVHSPTDHTTRVEMEFKERPWNYYLKVQKVGQLPLQKTQVHYVPAHYADEIKFYLQKDVFHRLCEQNNGPQWSTVLNCQTFTRDAITYLGFRFPHDIGLITECLPTMFDIYVRVSLSKAKTREKTNRKLSM